MTDCLPLPLNIIRTVEPVNQGVSQGVSQSQTSHCTLVSPRSFLVGVFVLPIAEYEVQIPKASGSKQANKQNLECFFLFLLTTVTYNIYNALLFDLFSTILLYTIRLFC